MSSLTITFILAILTCFCNLVSAGSEGLYIGIGGGVGGLIVLILDLIAIFDILRSSRTITGKLLWILLICFFPIGGFIFWLICGRKAST